MSAWRVSNQHVPDIHPHGHDITLDVRTWSLCWHEIARYRIVALGYEGVADSTRKFASN